MIRWKTLAASSLFAFQALGFQDVRANFDGHKVLEIATEDFSEDFAAELRKHEADHLSSFGGMMSFKVSPEGFEALKGEEGFNDQTEKWINQLQETLDHPDVFCRDHHADCAGRNLQDFHASYQTLDALTTRIGNLVDSSTVPAERKVIGTSSEGRPIHVVEIDTDNNQKPLAYFMCNIHAREWLTPMYCAYMIEMLLADGGHPLLDTFGFAIVPTGNPDGYAYSVSDNNMWRKTRNTNAGSRCIGTDGNRNWADNWGGEGTSDSPCSDIFCGLSPFSTPEVSAVNDYGLTIKDNIVTWTDFHAYGGYWLSPLGFSTDYPPREDYGKMLYCMEASHEAVIQTHGEDFLIGPAGALLYPAAGASDDHFYAAFGVDLSFTVEMRGRSFQPAASNIILSNEEIFAGMVAQMECAKELEVDGVVVPPAGPPTVAPSSPPTCFWFFC